MGCNTPTGLGYQNRDIAAQVPIGRWLLPAEEGFLELPRPASFHGEMMRLDEVDEVGASAIDGLDGIDCLLFVEAPLDVDLVTRASSAGVRIVCVCNWEWICPKSTPWLRDVDVMFCPTRHTLSLVTAWKAQYGFRYAAHYVPWPLDLSQYTFRRRATASHFVFVNGMGGYRPHFPNGRLATFRRKGLECLASAAALVPHIPLTVYTQTTALPRLPRHVQVRRFGTGDGGESLQARSDLYAEGDICIQPSHWEGLGYPLLECQASGMPLITTDAPPMNEHHPLATVPVRGYQSVHLQGVTPVAAPVMAPRALAMTTQRWYGREIETASDFARQFIEREHGASSWQQIRDLLGVLFVGQASSLSDRLEACPTSSEDEN